MFFCITKNGVLDWRSCANLLQPTSLRGSNCVGSGQLKLDLAYVELDMWELLYTNIGQQILREENN